MRVYSTIAKFSRHQMICLMLLLVAMLSGCASEQAETEVPVPPVVTEEPEPMSLLFACAPTNSNRALTRLADEVLQLRVADYRPITNLQVYAIKEGVPVNATVDTEQSSAVKSDYTKFFHYGYCSMPTLTNGCLVYAKAKDVAKENQAATLKYNGSLNAVFPKQVSSFEDIQFNLESILDATEARESGDDLATWEVEAWTLANALTAIIDESHNDGSSLVWTTSTNVILKNLLQRFTNNGADLPGSAASVKQWMLSLRDAADSYLRTPPISIGADEKALLAIISDKANTAAGAVDGNYPRDINLPDGAAVLRWTEVEEQDGENSVKVQKFVPQMQTTTLDDINSVSRFVYPPALYYFVESDIWTSNSRVSFNQYENRSDWKGDENTWTGDDDGTVQWLFHDGGTIMTNTKTVAIADPLQYAVAHLTMEVKAGAESLPYDESGNSENKIDINTLTLKGVIIGGQRPVDYKFEPINNSQYNVSFIYDSQVNSSNSKLSETSATYQTLALQSYDDEDVNIILEFEYSGDTGFKGLNGYVYPGTRFYLVGVLDPSQGTPPGGLTAEEEAELKKRVFTQDHTTSILLTVQSLEKAYNVLPSLLSNSLEIGVMITPKWISAEPSGPVILD